DWVDAEECINPEATAQRLKDAQGIIVPGGFGVRGIEGMIQAAQYARTAKVPYFGICLGMQIQVIEFARNVLRMENANSSEMDKDTAYPVIDLMSDQNGAILGGTLRLGKYECTLAKGSLAETAYGSTSIWERHRHRYEFNNKYREAFEKSTLRLTGINPERNLVEIVEQEGHPWMVGAQFHPEFKSRPNRAHPLFREFIAASVANSNITSNS
ncbi:MAG: gamma-glutamyl-gamma-aminobutyrate hydrolase family protein, partial [Spirochaetaceae bacterium]|nr:gamma-glutamyl-gamma-aminobutyrate hydrolase family protein [Spirochaetaceae bacterium]